MIISLDNLIEVCFDVCQFLYDGNCVMLCYHMLLESYIFQSKFLILRMYEPIAILLPQPTMILVTIVMFANAWWQQKINLMH